MAVDVIESLSERGLRSFARCADQQRAHRHCAVFCIHALLAPLHAHACMQRLFRTGRNTTLDGCHASVHLVQTRCLSDFLYCALVIPACAESQCTPKSNKQKSASSMHTFSIAWHNGAADALLCNT